MRNMTAQQLRTWFTVFNREYFGGELPEPRFVVNHAKRMLGQFSCRRVRKGLFKGYETVGYTIKVSEFYQMEERDYQSTLLHEMIHYYITYKGKRDTSAHGTLFRTWMGRLNRLGWNITISSNPEHLKMNLLKDDEQFLLLLMKLKDGRHMLTVVNPSYRKYLERQIAFSSLVAEHHWTVSKDKRFTTWSKARSLRGKRISTEEYLKFITSNQPEAKV